MDDDLTDFFQSLESDLSAPASTPARRPAMQHPCFECNGTGRYQHPRLHQPQSHCFACKGKGYFLKSAHDRAKSRARRVARKEKQRADFLDQHGALIERLRTFDGGFPASLVQAFDQYNSLTNKQIEAATSFMQRMDERRAQLAKEREAKSGDVNIGRIEQLFATAKSNGLKKPKFVADSLAIKLAPDHGRNAGALYVIRHGNYAGKIMQGKFHAVRDTPGDTLDLLRELAADPLATAMRYGKTTGKCCCCGRTLMDPESIERGIGPVCEGNWF